MERVFEDNVFTELGTLAHTRAHGPTEPDGRTRFGVRLWSDRLNLVGVADAVDFRSTGPYPIEYKLGRLRPWIHEAIQVCAQAMCLEEMFDCDIKEGAVFYQQSRQRRRIAVDTDLRLRTLAVVARTQEMVWGSLVPAPILDRRCRDCSLRMTCLPTAIAERRRLAQLRGRIFATAP